MIEQAVRINTIKSNLGIYGITSFTWFPQSMIRLAASAHLIHSFSGSLLNSHLQDVDAIYLDIKTADERSAECKSL